MNDLPEGISRGRVDQADDGRRLTDEWGNEWVVIKSKRTGESHVVHPDVVEYGQWDHPVLTGAGALATILFALIGPLAGVEVYDPTLPATQSAIVSGGALVIGYALARILLMRTFVGEFIARFQEWNEHRAIIEAGEYA